MRAGALDSDWIIRLIECYEVVVPARRGAVDSPGLAKPLHSLAVGVQEGWTVQFDTLPKLLVKITLGSGAVGWGECYRDHQWSVVEPICQLLLGRDIRSITLQRLPFAYCREYDGFECALYDLYGRVHDLKVVDLFGGAVRDRVKIGGWSSHRRKEEVPDVALAFRAQGYDCIKFKADLSDDVAVWCQSVAAVDPDMKVILDPNERWGTLAETRKRIRALEEVGNVLCLEDPIPRWKLNEYALLRSFGHVPIVLHISLPYLIQGQRVKDAIQAIELQAVDGFNFNGGAARFQQLAHISEASGLPCWHGSEVDLGILEAMYVHVSAAALSCVWPSDIFGRLIREHDLLEEPLKMSPPYVMLPDGPGLGVAPDMEAIKYYLTGYRQFEKT